MIAAADTDRVCSCLSVLRGAAPAVFDDFRRGASLARFPAGHLVFAEGDAPRGLPLVLRGSVRVFTVGKSGREVTLYRFGRGDGCILTMTAILAHQPLPARAGVEDEVEAVVVPADLFRRWVHAHEPWRRFVFDQLARRMTSVLSLVDELLSRRLDTRVAAFLAEHSRAGNPVRVTHQEIADELGSSREVISRILEGFAGAGLIRAGRGRVEVVDASALVARTRH